MANFLNVIENPAFSLVDEKIIAAFRTLGESADFSAVCKAAAVIADNFGPRGAFGKLVGQDGASREVEEKLVAKFHKNLQLLIKKSWVEKYDEALKEQVLFRLEKFCGLFSARNYTAAYRDFLEVLTDTVYLMFGQQAKKDDFAEYAMRIDPEFGLFWLYVKCLAADTPSGNDRYRIMILLGIIFLANY
jgi:hypothetical protein